MGDLLALNQSGELACSFSIKNVFHESTFSGGVDFLRGVPISPFRRWRFIKRLNKRGEGQFCPRFPYCCCQQLTCHGVNEFETNFI